VVVFNKTYLQWQFLSLNKPRTKIDPYNKPNTKDNPFVHACPNFTKLYNQLTKNKKSKI